MVDENQRNCPNCDKELRWLPKGKHTCLCGEVIETDGKDLQEVEIALINVPAQQERSQSAEILLGLAIIAALVLFCLSLFYHDAILKTEVNIIHILFGIQPPAYKYAVAPFIVATLVIVWLSFKSIKKIRKKA